MKKFVACLTASLALLGAPVVVHAQAPDAAATAAAQELFESMHYRSLMVDMMRQMSQNLSQTIRPMLEAAINNDKTLSAEQRKLALGKIDSKLPQINQVMAEFLNDPTLVDEMMAQAVPLYARNFTADEIRQIAAFYRTPVGAKMLAVMPKLAAESMQSSQQLMIKRTQSMMQKLIEAMQD
ncbi:DUF2059 domain-containing protein [Pseudoduganella sp. FT26W]|uniref:DUF2059 domain-containing protein n=1 Tax=Duganella aquatilis TaxID=2666082 RepID=A0A844D8E6_9BURK|nr:DUF2059 domain-containing protein [Duganella aquatilis]MRW87211.1 DUF2059 domain-containing protein [Duganella aquatilis]